MAITVIADECVGCESCIPICPVEALSMVEDKAVLDAEKCTECAQCVDECPVDAIKEE